MTSQTTPSRQFTATYTSEIFEKIEQDFRSLLQSLRDVLRDDGYPDLARALPWFSSNSEEYIPFERVRELHSLSIAFQLLNLVEENAAMQGRRRREAQSIESGEAGLWPEYLKELRALGYTPAEIASRLAEIHVEPVLTAHPTEAKRPTVLQIHRQLYLLLLQLENQMWTPAEREELHKQIRAHLERLWLTGEIRFEKPDVSSELENVLYYLRDIFPQVLPRLDLRLRQSWEAAGFNLDLIEDPAKLPLITFGDWVGGDRDGHPLVTEAVTEETLGKLRATALSLFESNLNALFDKLTISTTFHDAPEVLLRAIEDRAGKIPEGRELLRQRPHEPWRQFILLMQARLAATRAGKAGAYARPSEAAGDLEVLRTSLNDAGARRLAHMDVMPVERSLRVFGFHMASLDVRQNSAFHDRAIEQFLAAAGFADSNFSAWSEEKRLALVEKELLTARPFSPRRANLGPEAQAVLSCYRVLSDHQEKYGAEGIGSLIISMTRSLSDLLVVYLLAREAGLAVQEKEGLVCLLPVVPLFETLEDLEQAPAVLEAFLRHPVTQRSVARHGNVRPAQQVMIGYSDSNKDGGIVASQWYLHRAQSRLAEVGRRSGIRLVFFHGRGGTPSRGSGPTHRFLKALPHGSLQGQLRLTEQGETIAQKYANAGTATYNLELLMAGVAAETLKHGICEERDSAFTSALDLLAECSREKYQELLRLDGFLEYWSQATPIDVLEQAAIGSRPSRRTGRRSIEDLRAIPWVFSWNQSRHYIPGWFGVGTGLRRLRDEQPGAWEILRSCAEREPFFRNLMYSAETSLLSADTGIMREYAMLVQDGKVRDRIYNEIAEEHRLTDIMFDEVFRQGREGRRPRVLFTVRLRDAGLRRLHRRQVTILREWRAIRDEGKDEKAGRLLQELLLTVNAIASGLRTTG